MDRRSARPATVAALATSPVRPMATARATSATVRCASSAPAVARATAQKTVPFRTTTTSSPARALKLASRVDAVSDPQSAYRAYGPALVRKAERMLRNREDATDVVHALFVDLIPRWTND